MKKTATNIDGVDVYHYDSVDELLQDVEDREKYSEYGKSDLSSITGSEGFTMSKSYDHMLEIISNPVDFTEYINSYIEDFDLKTTEEELVTVYDIAGSYPDVGMFMTGEPECMVDFAYTPAHNKFATVVISLPEVANVEAKYIQRKAVILCAVVSQLESQNIRTRVFLTAPITDKRSFNHAMSTMCVKDYNQPLEINQLSAVHVSFFRRATFAWIEKYMPWLIPTGYGTPGNLSRGEFLTAFTSYYSIDLEQETVIVINKLSEDSSLEKTVKSFNKDSVQQYVEQLIKK